MNLILAQGANHTKPENLKKIIQTIQSESDMGVNYKYHIDELSEYLSNKDIDSMVGHDILISDRSYAVEEKYDGFSYINCEGRFFSKRLSQAKGHEGTPIEKTGHIPHISNILKKTYELCGADLHGEIYQLGGISDDVTRILGCTEDEALSRQYDIYKNNGPNGLLHYMLIDIRAFRGISLIDMPHRIRRAILKYVYYEYIKPFDIYGYIRLTEELDGDPCKHFNRIVMSGGEGIIIKREDALYVPGKKPANNWIKGKKKITHDVFMLGLNEGTGKNEYMFGSIEFGHIVDGHIIKCGNCSSGLSDEMREYIYNNVDNMILNHQVFEIEAIQESVRMFRNPVFLRLRNDKDWSECTPVDIRVKGELL